MLINHDVLCWVASCISEGLKITNVHLCDGKRATKQPKNVCPFTSIIKDQTTKARSLGIKCVSLLDINFDGIFWAKLFSTMDITRTSCCEKDLQFS